MAVVNSSRRHMLFGLAAGAGLAGIGRWAQAGSLTPQQQPLPEQTSFLIRRAIVITMDDELGDFTEGDVLVRHGRIAQVGQQLSAPDVAHVDGRGRIVFPGFIDAHNHMWQTQMRGMFLQTPTSMFFPLTAKLESHFRPQDIAISEMLSACENAAAGITTSNDFFDNNRSPAYAEAAFNALLKVPTRTRLLYGNRGKQDDQPLDLDHLHILEKCIPDEERDKLLLGLAWRLPRDLKSSRQWEIKRREYEVAREHQLPISVHVSGKQSNAMFQALIDGDYLFPGLQVVHASNALHDHLQVLEQQGSSLALTPVTEQRVGFGTTRYSRYAHLRRLGLGIDGNGLAGAADMFAVMRLLAEIEIGASQNQLSVDMRRLFRMATLGSACSMGLEHQLGSLTPGKHADIAMVNLNAWNLGMHPVDPITLLVFAARPENIEWVCVGGKVVKHDFKLVDHDPSSLLARARKSAAHLAASYQQA